MKSYPSLRERSIVLLLNVLVAFIVFYWANKIYLPNGGLETVWLVCAISYWFLGLLSAPWFVPPRDALISAVGVLLVLVPLNFSDIDNFSNQLTNTKVWLITFSIAVALLAVYSLLMHDKDNRSPPGKFAFQLTSIFGQGEVLFSGPAVISIVAAHQASFAKMCWLLLFWILVVVGKPIERIAEATRKLMDDSKKSLEFKTVGRIDRIDHPNIVRIKLEPESYWPTNQLFTASLPNGKQQFVVSLFSQVQGSEVVGTALVVGDAAEKLNLPAGWVCASHDEEMTQEFISNLSGCTNAKLVGFIVENSNIGTVNFELAADSSLQEGNVLFANISGQEVLYQIVGAETMEENFDQNPRGTHIVKAAQLGIYSPKDGFRKYNWLPSMNTPLFSAENQNFEQAIIKEHEFEIGKVPSTDIEVIARTNDLIEHHSAVLGVTGTGKTELALDIVRHAANQGVKVFCVDFTGEYKERLKDLNPTFPAPTQKQSQQLETELFAVDTGSYGASEEKKQLQKSIDALRSQTDHQVDTFLLSEEDNLAIFELAEIANTKATLRLTELYLSSIMRWAQQHRRARQILIVLEEAHTIVPEAYGAGLDYNTQFVVSRIGQIALQGRKYGVGLMVISQRTALVSKTILSQCNTFLTHSLIDQTSLNFLEGVYSSQHTKLIPNLGRFEFLAYGKGIKAERPIVVRRDFDETKLEASLSLNTQLPSIAAKALAEDTDLMG